MKLLRVFAYCMIAAIISACGGGGGSSSVATNTQPDNTTVSTDNTSNSTNTDNGNTDADDNASMTSPDGGFAGYAFELTGGLNGDVYTVNNGVDLQAKLDAARVSGQPITVYVDGVITDFNNGGNGLDISIKDMNNVSIIGVADRGVFDGIGLHVRRAKNIIIQNLTFKKPWPGQERDAISIEGDTSGLPTEHIWIDHCELYSSLQVNKDYFDGLIDSKSGARYITISNSYLHDHWKTSLHGHTEDDSSSANTDRFLTMHHNRFENLEARVPLFRHGKGHIYNNYYKNITSTAINTRAGAEVLVENNVFDNVRNPIVSFYSDIIGYWNLSGNVFTNVSWSDDSGTDITAQNGESTSTYQVPYTYELDPTDGLAESIIANAGVNKIDLSDHVIPDPVTPIEQVPVPADNSTATTDLPFNESFNTDSTSFFTADYRNLNGATGGSDAMYYRVTGTISLDLGVVSLTGARLSIGNTTPTVATTASDAQNTGVFDLSQSYQLSFTVVGTAGDTTKNFMVYVDNNTASSGNSIWSSASKFYQQKLSEFTPGQRITIPGYVASTQSFLTLRTESGATIEIDDLLIEYVN